MTNESPKTSPDPSLVRTQKIVFESPKPLQCGRPGAGYFALTELKHLNSGYYHDGNHALEVAELVMELCLKQGYSGERGEFLKQVALIHDADPREKGTPARVQATLAWMESERARLEERFGWEGLQFEEAFALISRTDYPFDRNPRRHGTRFDGLSPVDVYRDALWRLPRETRRAGMKDALLLRFCDQMAAYLGSFQRACNRVRDLVDELNNTGVNVCYQKTLKSTPTFLKQVGTDLHYDELLKNELNLANLELPTRTRMISGLGWKKRLRLARNLLRIRLI